MGVPFITFAPTLDLQLLMGQTGVPVTVSTVGLLGNSVDITAPVLSTLTTSKPGVIQVAGNTINPVTVGETLCVMSYADGAQTHYLLLRARVKNSIQTLWFGNNTVSLRTHDSCTLSVYAKFDDNSYGDISKHPYLTFSSDDSTVADIDVTGRVSAAGKGTTKLHVTGPGGSDTVDVAVQDMVTPNPIVQRIWGSGPVADRWNLLMLAEGFSSADAAVFDQWTLEITKRLFQSKAHSPYNLLRDSWNVWTAFEPSSERGITVGPTVNVPDASGFSPEYDFGHPDANGPRFLQAKDSRYGLMYGARLADRVSMIRTTPPAATDWYQPWRPFRGLDYDPRRPFWLNDEYYKTLKNKNATPGSVDYDVGNRWISIVTPMNTSPTGATQTGNVVTITTMFVHGLAAGAQVRIRDVKENGYNGVYTIETVPSPSSFTYRSTITGLAASGGGLVAGPDSGLVAFLVYDDRDAGTDTLDRFAAALGQLQGYRTTFNGTKLDHNPDPKTVVLDVTTAVFAHEMAHALGLGDEYEGYDDAGHTTLTVADKTIEGYGNLTDLSTIQSSSGVDPTKIKWNWDRMTQSSRVVSDINVSAGNIVDLTLKPNEGSMWANAKSTNMDVFLRQRVVDQSVADPSILRQGPLKITKINGDTVTVQGTVGLSEVKKGAVLYIPKRDSLGKIMTLIPNLVSIFIQRHGAFPRSDSNCSNVVWNSEDPPEIPGFHLPKHNSELVGLFTGGGTWNCNVFRPCGNCKMRSSEHWDRQWRWWPPGHDTVLVIPHFCFVCKYFLVDLIDSGQHGVLEKEYPEDC